MDMVPSVTTMGGSRSFQTSRPLQAPNKPPAISDSASTGATPMPGQARLNNAAIMPHNARFAAMDRSMPRTMMTSIWPSASMMRIAVSSSRPATTARRREAGKRECHGEEQRERERGECQVTARAVGDARIVTLMRRSPRAAGFRWWPARE